MKQMHADVLLKKTSRLSGFARKAFVNIRAYSRFLSFCTGTRGDTAAEMLCLFC